MYSFTKWIIAPVLAIGVSFVGDAPDAAAQYGYGFSYSSGVRGVGISIGVGNYGAYRSPYYGSYYRPYYGQRPYYHYPPHVHSRPADVIRYRNRCDVRRGHWDHRRLGRWPY